MATAETGALAWLGLAHTELSTQSTNAHERQRQRGALQAAIRTADPQGDEARACVTAYGAEQGIRARRDAEVTVAVGGRSTRVQPRRVNGTNAEHGGGWRVAWPRYHATRR